LGDPGAPKAVSLIAIHAHDIPDRFSDAALAAAQTATPPDADTREDLRPVPFVTIDPADARDRDDAVWAETDSDPANPGGHIVWVAIADVAHFVRPGSALDGDARKRGNSTYFPDRVVPMLPDELSGDLCSLHETVERSVIAVRMVFDASGTKRSHKFHRGLITSRASLTYTQAQALADAPDGSPISETITALFAAYHALAKARDARQPLDLDLPERRIELSDDGRVTSVALKERLDAHRLIEEFMVAANVAAAETLIARHQPLIFRVHEEPDPDRLEALRETLKSTGLKLAKGQVMRPAHLNRLLHQARERETSDLVSMATLRAMQQAYYHPENLGHFGLALRAYAHFTSPIRRYSDLVVHRALIAAHGWGDDGLTADEAAELAETSAQISATERRSMMAERETTDRYLAAFMAERIGNELTGRIAGMGRAGLFIRLDETGADGLVPMSMIGGEYFRLDRDAMTLTGESSRTTLRMGQHVLVRLVEATPVTGGLILELIEVEGRALPSGRKSKARRPRSGKSKRKVTRRRK
jgi:ribonuclease R